VCTDLLGSVATGKEDSIMTQVRFDLIQPGWKVFVGSDEVGEVVDVQNRHLDVRRGNFIKHAYRIPATYVAEAADGVVDLSIDRETVERLEHAASTPEDELGGLPRSELADDIADQPTDSGHFAR
jgi:hypothetical protein